MYADMVMSEPATVNFSVRMNKALKAESEDLLKSLGMNLTTAIQVFLKQVVMAGGLPFEVRLPNYKRATLEALAETERIGQDPGRKGMPLAQALAELKQ